MWTRQKKRSRAAELVLPLCAAAFISYFGYHSFHGEYGIYARERTEERVVGALDRYETLKAERMRMEQRIALLRDGTLDRDMIDEYARRNLNVARDDEVVIFTAGQSN